MDFVVKMDLQKVRKKRSELMNKDAKRRGILD